MGEVTSYTKEGIDELLAAIGDVVTQGDLDTAIAALVDSAPGTLDTLNELAAALADDPNLATTIATNLAAVKTGAMGVVIHGATAGTARPDGYGSIHWIGSVEPTNAIDNDVWTDTSA